MITKNVIKLKEAYNKPTPRRWRRIGDWILKIWTTLTAIAAYTGSNKWVIIGGIVLTALGKFLTNYAYE